MSWEPIGKLRIKKNKRSLWAYQCNCGCEALRIGFPAKIKKSKSCKFQYLNKKIGDKLPSKMWWAIKDRANRMGVAIDLTSEWCYNLFLEQNGRCALSGIPIRFADTEKLHRKHKGTTASLDRKDSSGGYTMDNVWWVDKQIQYMKGSLLPQEFIELCEKVAKYGK